MSDLNDTNNANNTNNRNRINEENHVEEQQERSAQQEVISKSDKRRKGNPVVVVIAVLLILAGAGIFSYPIIMQSISAYNQNKMQEELKTVILENMQQAQQEAELTNAADNLSADETATPSPTPLALQDIQVTEDDASSETENADNMKDRLLGQDLLGLIEIDSMNLFYAVVEGTEKDNLSAGIGHMTGTAAMGEVGNCVLAGHRGGTYGKYFRHIDELSVGDVILLTDISGTEYNYIVYDMFIVEPDEMWIIDPVDDSAKTLTMITCENNGTERLIVRARIQE